jgi:hypothetical protein
MLDFSTILGDGPMCTSISLEVQLQQNIVLYCKNAGANCNHFLPVDKIIDQIGREWGVRPTLNEWD